MRKAQKRTLKSRKMDTTPHNLVPEGTKTTAASRTRPPRIQARRGDALGRRRRGREVSKRILELHPKLLIGTPSWPDLAIDKIGLPSEKAFKAMVLSYATPRRRRPARTPQEHILIAAETYATREEEKRAGVANGIATPQKSVISAVSDAHESDTAADRLPLKVRQYVLGPLSLQAGGGIPMLADLSHTHMEFVATREVPRELALTHNPDKLFIIRVITRAMEPYYNKGQYLLVEATESIDLPDVHVIFEPDSSQFMLVYAKPLRDGSGTVEIHGNIKMEQLGIDKPTVEHASNLIVRGRVHDAMPAEVAELWMVNGTVNTSVVAC